MIATWTSAFETGIEDLDQQSKELFRMLRDLVTYHFYTEENIMENIGYPQLHTQKQAHEKFKLEINKINYIELKENPLKVIDHVRAFVELWIMQHMLLEDVKIGQYYKEKRNN